MPANPHHLRLARAIPDQRYPTRRRATSNLSPSWGQTSVRGTCVLRTHVMRRPMRRPLVAAACGKTPEEHVFGGCAEENEEAAEGACRSRAWRALCPYQGSQRRWRAMRWGIAEIWWVETSGGVDRRFIRRHRHGRTGPRRSVAHPARPTRSHPADLASVRPLRRKPVAVPVRLALDESQPHARRPAVAEREAS